LFFVKRFIYHTLRPLRLNFALEFLSFSSLSVNSSTFSTHATKEERIKKETKISEIPKKTLPLENFTKEIIVKKINRSPKKRERK
jgi:hypothetical protein